MSPATSDATVERRRWLALAVVCMAQLMIVLDTTIVNVALPSIQHDLHFTQGNLTWVINAFLVTFGSFLLLAGRLSDLIGRKRLFMAGLVIFTAASVACGFAPTQGFLIVARFVQGVGAALQASVILAIIVTEFQKPEERARAMGAYVFTAVAGGSLGLLAGGVLTEALSWHWIFFVNLPIGILTFAAARQLIPDDRGSGLGQGVDWLGSVLVTFALMALVYAIVSATSHGWGSAYVLGIGGGAVAMLAAFLVVESRVANPIMPLRILRNRGLVGGSLARAFLVTGMYSTFFLGTLYLEHIRHYSAIDTGLAYMPWTITVAAMSMGLNARLVKWFGPQRVVIGGMFAVALGLLLMTTTTATTLFFPTVFFAFFLIGLGLGNSFAPMMTMSMADVPGQDAGLGSGITTLAQQVGGAVGLAALSTIASSHTSSLLGRNVGTVQATLDGYHLAFFVGIGSILVGLLVVLAVLSPPKQPVADSVTELEEAAAESGGEVGLDLGVAAEVLTASAFGGDEFEPSYPYANGTAHARIRRRMVLPYNVRRPGDEPAPRTSRRERV
jgi:EmrB/QacA subfamily drug resistance transporter